MTTLPITDRTITPDRRALRVAEFCENYGVSRSCLYRLMRAGNLQTCRIGGRRLIPVEAAEALLKGAA
jgi:excisionase family DNA binding protein